MPRLWLGDPIGTGPPVEAVLHRRDGANLLAVTADPDLGQGIIISAMLSAVLLVHGENLGVLALDFMPPEAGFTEATKVLAGSGWTVQLARRRNISKVVDIIHRVVQDRLATSETRAKPVLFVMNGLSRAATSPSPPTATPIPTTSTSSASSRRCCATVPRSACTRWPGASRCRP